MHSEVALQAQSGGAESGTVGVLEVRGCDGCCRCSMVLISGSSELLVLSVLKVFNSFVSSAAPLWSFTDGLLQLLWFKFTPLKAGFDGVLVPFLRAALVSFALQKLSVQQASWHVVLFHPDAMSQPAELCLEEHGLDTCGVSTVQDFEVCNAVLQADSKDGREGSHMKVLQLLYVPAVECPRLTPVEERGESHSIVDSQLGRQPNVVLTKHSVSDYDFTIPVYAKIIGFGPIRMLTVTQFKKK